MPGTDTETARAHSVLECRRRAADLRFPLHALWEVTQRCHLRCRHCYLGGEHEPEELGTSEGKDLLGQMAGLGVMFLVITGGEPLLRGDLFDLVDEALGLGFAWKLLTTGTLVDEEQARRLAERHPMNVDISLHGLEGTHDALTRVPGSFRAATRAMKTLVGLGVRVRAKMNLTPRGLEDLPAFRELCAGMGVSLSIAAAMLPTFGGEQVDGSLRVSDGELAGYYASCYKSEAARFGEHRSFEQDELLCNAGRSAFAVSPRGDVRACLSLRRVFGNVRERPLRDIWRSEAMVTASRLVAGEMVDCRACRDARFCYYCPGSAEAECGHALERSPSACRDARVRHALAQGKRP